MSRIIVIGATGTIGSAICDALAPKHEVVRVAHSRGDFQVDLASKASIEKLFGQVGAFDGLISAAGEARFGRLDELGDDDFAVSVESKLMGQVNLVRVGRSSIADGGFFTLTSGILGRKPMPGSSALALVNGALEAFVRAAALELERGVRVNVVSPGWVKETMEAMGMDSSPGMPAAEVARAYVASASSSDSGATLEP